MSEEMLEGLKKGEKYYYQDRGILGLAHLKECPVVVAVENFSDRVDVRVKVYCEQHQKEFFVFLFDLAPYHLDEPNPEDADQALILRLKQQYRKGETWLTQTDKERDEEIFQKEDLWDDREAEKDRTAKEIATWWDNEEEEEEKPKPSSVRKDSWRDNEEEGEGDGEKPKPSSVRDGSWWGDEENEIDKTRNLSRRDGEGSWWDNEEEEKESKPSSVRDGSWWDDEENEIDKTRNLSRRDGEGSWWDNETETITERPLPNKKTEEGWNLFGKGGDPEEGWNLFGKGGDPEEGWNLFGKGGDPEEGWDLFGKGGDPEEGWNLFGKGGKPEPPKPPGPKRGGWFDK